MDIKQLEYFVTIAQTLNFTQAAKAHYITQPAISHRITDLETELGIQLFVRSKHRVFLTSAGEAFLNYAASMLDTADAALNRAKNIAMGREGHLRISVVPTCSKTLTEILIEFRKKYPDVDVQVDFSTGREQIIAINKDEYDFYFSFSSLIQACENLQCLETDQDRFGIFLPKKYANRVDPRNPSTLKELNLAAELRAAGPFLVDQMFSICTARDIDTSKIVGCRNHMSVFLLVNAEMAFTMFPLGMRDCVSTERIITYPLGGDDALVTNAVGWNPSNSNNTAEVFMNLLFEKYK
ncbi:DNA-binding transcriptional regulator, LysR family [Sporobacter termitidis DSM 10068]|uniref:DNA-binding transcriptional regulator, LysR family n=1 Tax=Sporobacter termitidis DSM 10068 TaxID=1123282 RepID=A0A1M5XUY4_9FIRM|nr:LysR family transcriptional regulator [Sporobacter termitidis]SHI03631.1 DNA-binding transcriptional regulator, LysR family [Sporobacter termitidis DSM 10068]